MKYNGFPDVFQMSKTSKLAQVRPQLWNKSSEYHQQNGLTHRNPSCSEQSYFEKSFSEMVRMTHVFQKKKTPILPCSFHNEWFQLHTTLHLFDPAGGGTDVLIHQNRTAPFRGWTPASKAAPPAGGNSCPPILNTRPSRAREDPQCYQRSLSRSDSANSRSYNGTLCQKQWSVQHLNVRAALIEHPSFSWLTLMYEHLKVAISYSFVWSTQKLH